MNETLAWLMGDYERRQHKLASSLISMGEELLREAKRLADAPDFSNFAIPVNSLGVLQGRGPDIDRQCGELSVLFDVVKLLQAAG